MATRLLKEFFDEDDTFKLSQSSQDKEEQDFCQYPEGYDLDLGKGNLTPDQIEKVSTSKDLSTDDYTTDNDDISPDNTDVIQQPQGYVCSAVTGFSGEPFSIPLKPNGPFDDDVVSLVDYIGRKKGNVEMYAEFQWEKDNRPALFRRMKNLD